MEWRRKDLKGLKVTISQYESSLGRGQVQPEGTLASEEDLSNSSPEGAMADDAPPALDFPSR